MTRKSFLLHLFMPALLASIAFVRDTIDRAVSIITELIPTPSPFRLATDYGQINGRVPGLGYIEPAALNSLRHEAGVSRVASARNV